MCSPTRAALLTGLNPHAAGVGTVAHTDPGFPGYAMELAADVADRWPRCCRDNGYATLMVGKWHLAKDSDQSDAGPRHSWPCQRGFDRFYGFLDGFTNLHHPHRLVEDNHPVEVDRVPRRLLLHRRHHRPGHRDDQGRPRRPTPTSRSSSTSPTARSTRRCTPRPTTSPGTAGRYDAGLGRAARRALRAPDRARRRRRRTPSCRRATASPTTTSRPWDDLPTASSELFARYMEVFAGMVDNVDQNVGRLRRRARRAWASSTTRSSSSPPTTARPARARWTARPRYYVHLLAGRRPRRRPRPHRPASAARRRRRTTRAAGRWRGNTPFRLYKINTHAGGHSVPFVVLVAGRARRRRRRAAAASTPHVTDLLPTLLELVRRRPRPTSATASRLKPHRPARSFVPTLRDADGADRTHRAATTR